MNPVPATDARLPRLVFQDALGQRVLVSDRTGDLLEVLRLRPELTAVASFEFALRERTARLANFRHAYYCPVRRVDRLPEPLGGLAVVSEHVAGARLSEILRLVERDHLTLDINAALCLIRQLVPAVALLHENARDVAHGALAPERLVVTPGARLVIVEHVLGSALEQLQFPRERYWRELGVAVPPSAGAARLNQRADVTQLGVVALALVLGRPLRADEYPHHVGDLLNGATELTPAGERQPLSPALRAWLARALQIDLRHAFESACEAQLALKQEVLSEDGGYIAAPVALETFLRRHLYPATAAPTAPPAPASAQPVPASAQLASAAAPANPAAPPPVVSVRPAPPPVERMARAETPASGTHDAGARPEPRPEPVQSDVPTPPPQPIDVDEPEPEARRRPTVRWQRLAVMTVAFVALVGGAFVAARALWQPPVAAASTGTLSVETRPAGVQVFVDGVARGVTPVQIAMAPGAHILELRGGGTPRVIPLTIAAGAQVSQYLELPEEVRPTGSLSVQSQPPGARVSIDGEPRGEAPVYVGDLLAGEHTVVVESDIGSVTQTVLVEPGASASLVVPLAPTGVPLSGWVATASPVDMQVYEQGRLLGSTRTDRIMMAAGRHDLEFVNETLGFRVARSVQVLPGKVTTLKLEMPLGTMHLNALPWAEVWIDGQRVGETPLGNLAVPIGPHEIIFRHPELGEKSHAVTVTLAAPARVSVDLRR